MFEVEYPWNAWVKKEGVNANLVYATGLTLDTPENYQSTAVPYQLNAHHLHQPSTTTDQFLHTATHKKLWWLKQYDKM